MAFKYFKLLQVTSSNNVKVVIETGGTKHWTYPYIHSDVNQRWLLRNDWLKQEWKYNSVLIFAG